MEKKCPMCGGDMPRTGKISRSIFYDDPICDICTEKIEALTPREETPKYSKDDEEENE